MRKKDGTIRFCVDYRKLNDVTHKDAYPLLRINDILEALRGATYLCCIDLASGYWQIKVADKDREKTAFCSHMGLYEFLYIPFGLTEAPATFLRLMDKVLDGLIGKNCLVYLDNVIIFGSSFEETLANLKLVMGRLCDHNLLCKARKCELFEKSIYFLGHVVSKEGIATDPAKVEKICNLFALKDKSGIRSILGLGNYYKRFIKSYCVITAPLEELLKKSVHFRWGDEQEQAFINLRDALCKALVLAYPDPDAPYVVDTDASNLAIGAVLSQVQDSEEKVIMYGSKAFSSSQGRRCTTRRELFAVIHFVMVKFSYYLLNQEFTLHTDHSSLRWLDSFHDKATDILA